MVAIHEAKPLISEAYHKPVLLREAVKALNIESGGWYIDATVGLGGHSLEILKRGGKVVGIDVDEEALEQVKERLQATGYRQEDFVLKQGNFRDLKKLIPQAETDVNFKGVVFDLGVSSLQLETPQRGFSFGKVGPLDMRMDPTLQVRALDLVKALNEGELYELFAKLGEEKFARSLARALVSSREVVTTTKDLADLVAEVYRKHGIRNLRVHPATRVFQALRIAVNDELNALREALPQALELIEKNGHIVVTSFHSLEDRIVKNCFRDWEAKGYGGILTKKPIAPGEAEIKENPRSRSGKLRVFLKT